MADPGNGEFPLWPLNQPDHHPLFSHDVLGFMAEIRPTREELMANAPEEPSPYSPPSNEATAGEESAGSPMQADDAPEMESFTQLTFFPGESSHRGPPYPVATKSSRPLSILPQPLAFRPLTCCCCKVLREIVHTNGFNTRKLEIHGRFGIFCHAIHEDYFSNIFDPNSAATQYNMFDFSKKTTDEVKQFIMQYCLKQLLDDYMAVPEPLSDFYDVLCVGLDWGNQNFMQTEGDQQPAPLNTVEGGENEEGGDGGGGGEEREGEERGEPQMEQQEEPEGRRRARRTALAMQRQRTGKMTLNDFKGVLHLPISEAAKKMNLCLTVVKKICRRSGLRRWPYRKVKSYQRKMGALGANLRSRDPETRARAEAEMERLRQELAQFCAGIIPE